MTLLDKIKTSQMNARKAAIGGTLEQKHLATFLTTLLSEILTIGKNQRRDIKDDDSLKVIQKFLKNIQEIQNVAKEEKVLKSAKFEQKVLEEFLPQQLSKDELTKLIHQILKESPTFKIGNIMKHLNQNYKGRYNGKLASIVIDEVLNG